MLFTLLSFNFAGTYSGGTGSQADPYQISNFDDLLSLQTTIADYGAYFIQTADIDASASSSLDGGAGFLPIGKIGIQLFSGNYNGNGKNISNLTINRPAEDQVGLFGYTNNCTIVNVHLINASIKGKDNTGGIAGLLWNGAIVSQSSFDGTLTGAYHVGGIAGDTEAPEANQLTNNIEECSVSGTVVGNDFVGGVIGLHRGIVRKSSCSAIVEGVHYVGGICGNNYFNNAIIETSFSTSNVKGRAYLAGLVGYNVGTVQNCYAIAHVQTTETFQGGGLVGENYGGNIINCYAATTIVGDNLFHAGLLGFNHDTQNPSPIASSYWDKEATNITHNSGGGTGLLTADMKNQANYTNWDFNTTWEIVSCKNYPVLQWQQINCENTDVAGLEDETTVFTQKNNQLIIQSEKGCNASVYALSGVCVMHTKLHEGMNIIDINSLQKGIYCIQIQKKVYKISK
jgi:hypothetical protein